MLSYIYRQTRLSSHGAYKASHLHRILQFPWFFFFFCFYFYQENDLWMFTSLYITFTIATLSCNKFSFIFRFVRLVCFSLFLKNEIGSNVRSSRNADTDKWKTKKIFSAILRSFSFSFTCCWLFLRFFF